MAGLRRTQDIDQWRPEELSPRVRERSRERTRERIHEPRTSSPVTRAARDTSRRTHDTDTRPSAKHAIGRSRERSLDRDRTRRRSQGASKDDRYRASRREPSADRVSHPHPHPHHRDHRDSTPSSKRHRSRSASPRDSHKWARRQRSRSAVRSRSRTRRADSTHRPSSRAYSPRPPRSDRDRTSRRTTPDTYVPPSSARRRSPSADSYYRPLSHRPRKRSISPARSTRRALSPRRSPHRRPGLAASERPHKVHGSRERSRSRASRRARTPSPRRRRSPPPLRRPSPPRARNVRSSPRRSRSPRFSSRRSRSPVRSNRDEGTRAFRADQSASRRDSPAPASGYNSDTSNSKAEDAKMRGAYHHQGRGGPGYQHSPPYPAHNQNSPHNQSPYHGGRGGWNGHQYSNQGSV